MNEDLSEEEMRRALFGSPGKEAALKATHLEVTSDQQHVSKSRKASILRSPKLRVTLRVMSEFEGKAETLIYDASTLSSIVAEQEAKMQARKKKFKYFELVSIESI